MPLLLADRAEVLSMPSGLGLEEQELLGLVVDHEVLAVLAEVDAGDRAQALLYDGGLSEV